MKSGIPLLVIGISMFILGLLLFYLINPEENKNLEIIKNTGTFVGLSGIGVTLAGILVYLPVSYTHLTLPPPPYV